MARKRALAGVIVLLTAAFGLFQNFSFVGGAVVADFLNFDYLPRGQRLALISLQGLANRQGALIYLTRVDETNWIAKDLYAKNAAFAKRRVYSDLAAIVRDYRSAAGLRGAVIWDPRRPFTLNVATNLSGAQNLLMITPEMKPLAAQLGLPVAYDLTAMFREFASEPRNIDAAARWSYNTLYAGQSREWLGSLYYQASHDGERDFMIQNRIHVFWLPSPGRQACKAQPDPEYSPDLQAMIQYELQHAPANTPVLGIWQGHDDAGETRGFCEYDGVMLAGQFGKFSVPTDFATNYSFHSKASAGPTFRQPASGKAFRKFDRSKKYVALVMQESGDSPGYFQTSFRYSKWDDARRGQVPISYGISPMLPRLMPALVEHLYKTATANDYFYSSVSGLGYMYPFPQNGYAGYGQYGVMAEGTAKIVADQRAITADYFKKTAQAMAAMDLQMMGLYSSPWTAWNPAWDDYLRQNVVPQLPGRKAIVADMGREEGMTPAKGAYALGGGINIYHTVTRWNDRADWFLNPWSASTERAYDAAAAKWLADEIKANSAGADARFVQAMFLSWQYNPRRLALVRDALAPLGYEFVTLNELDDLYRQAEALKPTATASGIWNRDTSGAFAAARAIDGVASTRWASNNDGAATWLLIDLKENRFVTAGSIKWEAAGSYKVEVSIDGRAWAQIATGTAATSSTTKLNILSNDYGGWWARYVRVAPAKATDPQYRSIYEVSLTMK